MRPAAMPGDEAERLAALHRLQILDTEAEAALDDLVVLASELCDAPIALVSLIDAERQWFKAKIGIDGTETPRELAFCSHAILEKDIFVVRDALEDDRFADNPYVTGDPKVRFYAGAPLRLPDGHAIGTLCIIDRVPRTLTAKTRGVLEALQRQAEAHLAVRVQQRALVEANAELSRTQRSKDALVQFIVHDMKNALTSVIYNAQALSDGSCTPDTAREIGLDIEGASNTLKRLVFDIMDVGRAELGGSLVVTKTDVVLDELLTEVAKGFASRLADARVSIRVGTTGHTVHADASLLKRVLENFVDNAIRYSPPGSEILLTAEQSGRETIFRVSDCGPGIPPEMRDEVFALYTQAAPGQNGTRGIGLAFCRLAVLAHDGRIWVEPNQGAGTSFCAAI